MAWDAAVREVEGYRLTNGLRDRDTALGAELKDPAVRMERRRVQDSIRRAQRQLGIERTQRIELAQGDGDRAVRRRG